MHRCTGDLLARVPTERVIDGSEDRVAGSEASLDDEPDQDESEIVGQPGSFGEEPMEGADVFPAHGIRRANDAGDRMPACREGPPSHQGYERRERRRGETRDEGLKEFDEAAYDERVRHEWLLRDGLGGTSLRRRNRSRWIPPTCCRSWRGAG